MKDTFYFTHDYNARNDWKLVKVMMKHWLIWVWAYWCIVEMLYEEWWYLPLEYERITFELRTTENVIQSLINDFWLFENDWENFWSNSIIDRLKERQEKSEKAKQSIQARWDKKNNTNVLRTNYDSNTIKERKEKKRKEKEIYLVVAQPNEYQESIKYLKEQNIDNIDIPEYAEQFRDEWIKFILYWTEKGKTWKIRAETEKTFEIKRRFANWMSRKKDEYQKTQQPKRLIF